MILAAMAGCAAEPEAVREYNEHLVALSVFLEKQDEFAQKINDTFLEPEANQEAIADYLKFVDEERAELEEFKVFIEENYVELRESGKDPVLIRDLLKIILENNEANEEFFLRCNQIFERYNA